MAQFDDDILEPAIAGAMVGRDPSSVVIRLAELPATLGISLDELLTELRAGRLVAIGQRAPDGGWGRVGIAGDEMLRWLACGSRIAKKARKSIKQRNTHG